MLWCQRKSSNINPKFNSDKQTPGGGVLTNNFNETYSFLLKNIGSKLNKYLEPKQQTQIKINWGQKGNKDYTKNDIERNHMPMH